MNMSPAFGITVPATSIQQLEHLSARTVTYCITVAEGTIADQMNQYASISGSGRGGRLNWPTVMATPLASIINNAEKKNG